MRPRLRCLVICLASMTGALWSAPRITSADPILDTLYSFVGNHGFNPATTLTVGRDGAYYGVAQGGGAYYGGGAIFRVDPNGAVSTLVNFPWSYANGRYDDGEGPVPGLVLGKDGDLYGATRNGGAYNFGTLFKVNASGVLTVLHSFSATTTSSPPANSDGAAPAAGLIQAADGDFYGTAAHGGANGTGTLFKISPSGVFTTLYSFSAVDSLNHNSEGAYPFAPLFQAKDGNFYGSTTNGGLGSGTLFQFTSAGALTVLHTYSASSYTNFGVNADGATPYGSLTQGRDGSLYGTTIGGGFAGHGTIFKVTSGGGFTLLHSFTGGTDGSIPYSGLTAGQGGAFYGTTFTGGLYGYGVVYKMSQAGALTPLHSFALTPDGYWPQSGLTFGRDGSLYGATSAGGVQGTGLGTNGPLSAGTIFKLTPAGTLTTIHQFDGGSDGAGPAATLVQYRNGDLYGTTGSGGPLDLGTIFRIDTSGLFASIYSFSGNDGSGPNSALIAGRDGALYGATYGTLFRFLPFGTLSTVVTNFAGNYGGVIQGRDGNFYIDTILGGEYTDGAILQVTPSGVVNTFASFDNTNGAEPFDTLIQGRNGDFYGTANAGGAIQAGCVFQCTPSGTLTSLHDFALDDGLFPYAPVTQAINGDLYGTCFAGGTGRSGTVFKLTLAGVITVLHSFNAPDTNGFNADGLAPTAGLLMGKDGNLYGVTPQGGPEGLGVVFRVSPNGTFTTLHAFTGSEGASPAGGLIQASDGNLYGTTQMGGEYGFGVVFRLVVVPQVDGFAPASGPVGTVVTVNGNNFTNTRSVRFGAASALFTVVDDSILTVTVPSGAVSGPITVVNGMGKAASSSGFIVTP